ncbi:olfactory receptor 10H1-like, partial [Amphibalanus amphitrite]|uniref:olfactory receptor 10H1-like n=1 Tax=Amphibalanus amphitrite TaxID=1232801 RepID=UPI001C9184FD
MASKILPMGTMLVGFFGAISSSVPIIAIMTSPSLRRQPMFRTITNLALCETWFLICGGVLGTVNVIGVKLTPVACAVFQSHNLSIGIGSSAALVVVSVERYVSVVHGLRYSALLTPRRLWLLLLAPWLVMGVSWVTFSTLAAGLMVDTFGHSPLHCRFLDVMPPPLKLAATGSATVICVLIVVLNGVISRVAVRHQHAISSQLQLVGRDTEENVSAYWGVLRVTAIYVLFS